MPNGCAAVDAAIAQPGPGAPLMRVLIAGAPSRVWIRRRTASGTATTRDAGRRTIVRPPVAITAAANAIAILCIVMLVLSLGTPAFYEPTQRGLQQLNRSDGHSRRVQRNRAAGGP
jgi:hypothetical protein